MPTSAPSVASALTLVAGILFLFFCIGNFSIHQLVPRHIRIVKVTTIGLGSSILATTNSTSSPRALYGDPAQPLNLRRSGDGLRLFYTWGLWNRCAGYEGPSHPQYCTSTTWALPFRPTEAILEDVPSSALARARSLLVNSDSDNIKSDSYLGTWSRIAFYFIVIALFLVALMIVSSLLSIRAPGRLAFLNLLLISFLALVSALIGTVIWTAIIGVLKLKLNGDPPLGVRAMYGNALWILWAIDGVLLFSILPYAVACIRGRPRSCNA